MLVEQYLDLKKRRLREANYHAIVVIFIFLAIMLFDYPLFYSVLPLRGFALIFVISLIDVLFLLYFIIMFLRFYFIKTTHDVRFFDSHDLKELFNAGDKHLFEFYGFAENDKVLIIDVYSIRGPKMNLVITLDKQKDNPAILKRFEKGRQKFEKISQRKWLSIMMRSGGDIIYYDQRTR